MKVIRSPKHNSVRVIRNADFKEDVHKRDEGGRFTTGGGGGEKKSPEKKAPAEKTRTPEEQKGIDEIRKIALTPEPGGGPSPYAMPPARERRKDVAVHPKTKAPKGLQLTEKDLSEGRELLKDLQKANPKAYKTPNPQAPTAAPRQRDWMGRLTTGKSSLPAPPGYKGPGPGEEHDPVVEDYVKEMMGYDQGGLSPFPVLSEQQLREKAIKAKAEILEKRKQKAAPKSTDDWPPKPPSAKKTEQPLSSDPWGEAGVAFSRKK